MCLPRPACLPMDSASATLSGPVPAAKYVSGSENRKLTFYSITHQITPHTYTPNHTSPHQPHYPTLHHTTPNFIHHTTHTIERPRLTEAPRIGCDEESVVVRWSAWDEKLDVGTTGINVTSYRY